MSKLSKKMIIIQIDGRLTSSTFFSSDQDNAISASCTIDGCRRSVLEDINRFNIIRINEISIITKNAIDHIERPVSFRIYCRSPADLDGSLPKRVTIVISYKYTSSLSLQGIKKGNGNALLDLFCTNGRSRTGNVALLGRSAVSYNHYTFQVRRTFVHVRINGCA